MRTVVGLYDRFQDAQETVQDLHNAGFSGDNINLIARDASGDYTRYLEGTREGRTEDVTEGAATGAGVGAAMGGLAGLLVGLGALAIPGIGPVIAAGPIISTLAGAGIGAVTGGMIGALADLGVPEEHANLYSEGVRRGGTLVVARVENEQVDRALGIMNLHNPVDIERHGQMWRQENWSRFDQAAEPLERDRMQFNRSYYTGTQTGFDQPSTGMEDRELDMETQLQSDRDFDRNRTGTFSQQSVPVTGDESERDYGDIEEDQTAFDRTRPHDTFRDQGTDQSDDIPITGTGMPSTTMGMPTTDVGDWDRFEPRFRQHCQMEYGTNYSLYEPAYRFGYDLAHDPRYRGYDWRRLETEAHNEWQQRGLRGAWDDVKDAVRHAWESVTG